MSIGKWFEKLSFMGKMMLVYTVFAVLPMVLVTVYNYQKTRKILERESIQDIKQSMVTMGKSLESTFQAYSTVMDLLYTNQMLNSYLSVDYTNLSFEEMFYYIDKQVHSIMILNPNINRISFYSTNQTLPRDNYYFYQKEDLPSGFVERADQRSGSSVTGGIMERDGKLYVGLIRKLNYFSSGEIENYLVMLVDALGLSEQLRQQDSVRQMYLVDDNGQILAADEPKLLQTQIGTLVSEWRKIPTEGDSIRIYMDNVEMICLRREAAMGANLLLLMDRESLFAEAKDVSHRILLLFLLSSFIVISMIFLYGRIVQKRVDKVVYAAKRLGDGQFDYILTKMGQDEFGQIADAFNLLNERIQILIRDNYEKKLLIKTSEMNLLQEQINPHFLYNALSVISSMAIREGGKKTVESVRYLADFYRISLNKGRQVVSVQEELELLQNYMKIQKIRFGQTIEIFYEFSREVLPYRIIKLILQPLVENAIHHGRREEQTLEIQIKISVQENKLVFEVEDNGLGIEPKKLVELRSELKKSKEGFGLKNVDARVKLHYGEAYGVTVNSVYGKGTQIRVEIPLIATYTD